jgi:gas vesicle protein
MRRFLLGFMTGAALSATTVILYTPRSGDELRPSLTAAVDAAVAAGRAAAVAQEAELWSEFHQRLKEAQSQATALPPGEDPYQPPLEY